MKLTLADAAKTDIEAIAEQWPGVFAPELKEALLLLRDQPYVGPAWPTKKRKKLHQLLIEHTGHHLYYRVDTRRQAVIMLRAWHGRRGTPPRL